MACAWIDFVRVLIGSLRLQSVLIRSFTVINNAYSSGSPAQVINEVD